MQESQTKGCTAQGHAHFECEPCLDLFRQHLGNHAIEIVEDLHGQLRLDAAFVDEIVDSVDERLTDTGELCQYTAALVVSLNLQAQQLVADQR
jgi:hypothetical protein